MVTPYYNKPTQDGLLAHFTAVHDATDLPLIIYNIPGRSVVDMSVDTMAALARLPNVVGVKDATNDLARPLLTAFACGEDFCQLSGEDITALAFLANGGAGCISVTANVAPRQCAQMQDAWQRGDAKGRLAIHLARRRRCTARCSSRPARRRSSTPSRGSAAAPRGPPAAGAAQRRRRAKAVEAAMVAAG